MLADNEKLKTLTRLGIELNEVQDLDILLERVLTQARLFANADAGSIYILDGDSLHFTYTQNDTLRKQLPRGEKLIYSTFTIPVDKTSMAGYVAETGDSLNIDDVYRIEPTRPYRFKKGYDDATGYRTRSALTIPLKTSSEHTLGILQIINAQSEDGRIISFSDEDEINMHHFASLATVALERAQMTRAMILRMIRMAEMRDPKETGAHVNRVAGFSLEVFEWWARIHQISFTEVDKTRDILRMAAMLHDVGKVAISDTILKKPAKLEDDEFEIMKQHTVLGARLFQDRQSDFDDAAAQVALCHHERWDGKGYPGHVDPATGEPIKGRVNRNGKARGKSRDEIPLFGRIVSIADVYDALCSRRSYKEAWDEDRVLTTMNEGRASQFDPELMDIFLSRMDVMRSIQARYVDDGG